MHDPKAEGRRWLGQAENDLAFARHALGGAFFHQVCFIARSQPAPDASRAPGEARAGGGPRVGVVVDLGPPQGLFPERARIGAIAAIR